MERVARRLGEHAGHNEGLGSFVAFTAVFIASGWSELVPGRELHPL